MKKLKIAQIGTADTEHGSQVFKSLNHLTDTFELVGFADVDVHSGARNSAYDGHREMTVEEIFNIPGLDAVTIECDENLQTKYALMAAQRGIPFHLEKPCGDVDADFDRLIDVVEEKNLVFHTGYMYRYNPAVQKMFEIVKSGRLGEIYSVEAQMNCIHPVKTRNWLANYKGGMMFYLGCHLVDLICQLQGWPDRIEPLNMAIGTDGVKGEDFGMALMHYRNGVSMAKTTAVEAGGFQRRQLVVCGTKGTIEIKPLEGLVGGETVNTEMTEYYLNDDGYLPWGEKGVHTVFEPYNRYDGMMESFAAMVRGEKVNPYTPEYERQLHKRVLMACGVPVKL
ncbi:MAG: Gfo/Idh/MocA family oxidoreductase [Clostridia bacterium]|nr:Gfo/Idh/MocA family oxidoreductase [Clostridia bacterium]